MTLEEYQKESRKTAMYPDKDKGFIFPALGLMGEAGEVGEKIKKTWRDNNCRLSESDKKEIAMELGDVLWYLTQLSTELNLSLEDIARSNLEKTKLRKQNNKIGGTGNNR
jgi:NTP pyrophosphatase (non-canonical NTP hydrolase)